MVDKDPKLEWKKVKNAFKEVFIDIKKQAQSEQSKQIRMRMSGGIRNMYQSIRERATRKNQAQDPQYDDAYQHNH